MDHFTFPYILDFSTGSNNKIPGIALLHLALFALAMALYVSKVALINENKINLSPVKL